MICRACAAQTTLTVLLAFVGAPLLHLHTAEQHGHDGRPVHGHETVIHTHLPEAHEGLSSAGDYDAELSHGSHEAKPVEVFAIAPSDRPAAALPFLLVAWIELAPTPVSMERLVLQFAPRTHDPPLFDRTSSRAPPV